jgi:hypothetical protein
LRKRNKHRSHLNQKQIENMLIQGDSTDEHPTRIDSTLARAIGEIETEEIIDS